MPVFEFVYDARGRLMEAGETDLYAGYQDETIKAQWAAVLAPENILIIEEPKGIADILLGVLALSAGGDLSAYMDDMTARGQTEERRKHTSEALGTLAMSSALVQPSKPLVLDRPAEVQRRGKTKRL